MSTKIYNAYLYKGTLHSLVRFLDKLRDGQQEKFVKEAAGLCAPDDFNFGAFTQGFKDMLRRGLNVDAIGDVYMANPACSAVVYAARVGGEDRLIVQFFGISEGELDKLLPQRLFKDFHYQNQSDHAESASEWALRKRVWDRIFRRHTTPAQAGLTFEMIGEDSAHDLSMRVFAKMHGHRAYDQEAGAACEICKRRRAKIAAEEEKKELTAAPPGTHGPGYGPDSFGGPHD